MHLNKACEIAKACGLTTIEQAIINVELHAMNMFLYHEIDCELLEMYTEFENSGLVLSDGISKVLGE